MIPGKRNPYPTWRSAVKAVDCVVIITNHSQYDYAMILNNASLIVDTRNASWQNRQRQQKSGEVVMAKYIVTGAAGFIAARVVEMLAEAGHNGRWHRQPERCLRCTFKTMAFG